MGPRVGKSKTMQGVPSTGSPPDLDILDMDDSFARRRLDFTPTTDERLDAMERQLHRTSALLERALRQNEMLRTAMLEMHKDLKDAEKNVGLLTRALQFNKSHIGNHEQRILQLERMHDMSSEQKGKGDADDHDAGSDHDHSPQQRPRTPTSPSASGYLTMFANVLSDDDREEENDHAGEDGPESPDARLILMDQPRVTGSKRDRVQEFDDLPMIAAQLENEKQLEFDVVNALRSFPEPKKVASKEDMMTWWIQFGVACLILQPLVNMLASAMGKHGSVHLCWIDMLRGAPDYEVNMALPEVHNQLCIYCFHKNVPTGFTIRRPGEGGLPMGRICGTCFKRVNSMQVLGKTLRSMARRVQSPKTYPTYDPTQYIHSIQQHVKYVVDTDSDSRWDYFRVKRVKVDDTGMRPDERVVSFEEAPEPG